MSRSSADCDLVCGAVMSLPMLSFDAAGPIRHVAYGPCLYSTSTKPCTRTGRCHSDAQQRPQQQMRRPGEPRRRPVRTQYFGDVDVDGKLVVLVSG